MYKMRKTKEENDWEFKEHLNGHFYLWRQVGGQFEDAQRHASPL